MGKLAKQRADRMRRLEWAQQRWLLLLAAAADVPDDALMSVSLVSTPGATRSNASFSAPARYIRKFVPAELVELDWKMTKVDELDLMFGISAPGNWTRGVP